MRTGPEALPAPSDMDIEHRAWRSEVIQCARAWQLSWTHGIAAKLINCYLKAAYVTLGSYHHPGIEGLHPPIDRLLLNALSRKDKKTGFPWARFRDRGWSSFDSEEYESVITAIRDFLGPGQPMWMVEHHWSGHQ